MVTSLFAHEFAEKMVKKYISQGLWLDCSLAEYYVYLEYYDEGGYGSIHKVMNRRSGDYLILKRSSKKDFVPGTLNHNFNTFSKFSGVTGEVGKLIIDPSLQVSKEAEFMTKIHEKLNGLKLHDYYDDDAHYILVMENGGRSLESIACSHRKKIQDLMRYEAYQSNYFYHIYLSQIIKYVVEVYHKIKAIHDLGIHHNDLKPENILIESNYVRQIGLCSATLPLGVRELPHPLGWVATYKGAVEYEAIIIDYGVAKSVEESYTSYKGTLEYIPYEYVENGFYKPWDHTIWCFGIMLHFLTLMKYPFLREEDVLAYHLNKNKINKLPHTFSSLIYDCLQKDPTKRPQNLLERLKGLQTY
jgi:serine/threonine protein kinase